MQQHHSQNAAQHAAQRQLCTHTVQLIRRGLRLGQLRFSMFLRRHRVLRLSFQFRLWRSGCLFRCLLRLFTVQRQQRQAHGVLFCGRLLCRGQRCLRCVLALRLAKEIDHRLLFRLLRFFRLRYGFRLQLRCRLLYRCKHSRGQRCTGQFLFAFSRFSFCCRGCFGPRCRLFRLLVAQAVDHRLELCHLLLLLLFLRQQHLRRILGVPERLCRAVLLCGSCRRDSALPGCFRLHCRRGFRRLRCRFFLRLFGGCFRLCILCFLLQKMPRGQFLFRVCLRLQHQFQIRFRFRLRILTQPHLTGRHFLRLLCCSFVSLLLFLTTAKQAKPFLRLFLRLVFVSPGHLLRDIHRRGAEKGAELFIRGHFPAIIFIFRHSCPSCNLN